MSDESNSLISVTADFPAEIVAIANLIQSNQLTNWEISKRQDGTIGFSGTDPNGDMVIIEKKSFSGYSRTTTETMSRPSSISDRRNRVQALRNEGHTQTEIAKRTGFSQKTISNDYKILNELETVKSPEETAF